MTTQEPETETPEAVVKFVGYGPAATYLGLKRNTLSSYAARGIGPKVHDSQAVDQYNMPVFLQSDLDQWRESRPGQGRRTDLIPATV